MKDKIIKTTFSNYSTQGIMTLKQFEAAIEDLYTTEISEEEIKKKSAFYEAKCRCEHPDIESDDWYFDYVNEDFIAGYMAALSKHLNETQPKDGEEGEG